MGAESARLGPGFPPWAGHRVPAGAAFIRKRVRTPPPPSHLLPAVPAGRAAQPRAHRVLCSPSRKPDIWDEERSGAGMKATVYYEPLSYFLYGWPDLYNGANSHRGVYRAKTGCALACLTALSARVIFLGSCFHDKIFSDSIFACKPLKGWFCLM